jgi:cyanophycinase
MDDENRVVWERVVKAAGDGAIAVLPTASGVPERSGPGMVELFEEYGGKAVNIPVSINQPDEATSKALVALIEQTKAVWFTGGDQRRVTKLLRNADGYELPVSQAVWDVVNAGGFLGGTSAGAAMQSDPMINGGSSHDSLLTGYDPTGDTGVGTEPGMGFFPWGLIDQHHIQRGRTGRLIIALQENDMRFGYGIDENSALEVDRASASGFVLSGSVLMIDMQEFEGGPGIGVKNARLSILRAGDKIDFKTGAVTPAGTVVNATDSMVDHSVDNVWRRAKWSDALEEMLTPKSPSRALELKDKTFSVNVTLDSKSQLTAHEANKSLTLINGLLEIKILKQQNEESDK